MADSNKKIITGTGKVSFWSKLFNGKKTKKFWVVTAIGALIVISAIVLLVLNYIVNNSGGDTVAPEEQLTTSQNAEKIAIASGYAPAVAYLNSQIKSDDPQAASLLEEKAVLALAYKDYDVALGSAQQAEALAPTLNSAQLMAKAAEGQGNTSLALRYYKLVLKRMDQESRSHEDVDYKFYADKVKKLGG